MKKKNATEAVTRRTDRDIRTLSIVIPAYNEENTIRELIERVIRVELIRGIEKEIIIVDDGSEDRTPELLVELSEEHRHKNIKVLRKENGGKGSAARLGFAKARGELIIVQDADLEYDPNDFNAILDAFHDPSLDADVVYGSRILRDGLNRNNRATWSSPGFYLGGRLLTVITNLLYGTKLTDAPTCYKAFRTSLLKEVSFRGNGFEWEPEITAKIAKRGVRIREVPISYHPRTIAEGKKLRPRDGLKAIWTLLKYRFVG